MLRALGRGLAALRPDPHLTYIAGVKSPKDLFAYLSGLPKLTVSQQTLSFKILSRFLREANGSREVFDHPLYHQIRLALVPQFRAMTASQTLDVLFWLRVCKQNGKQELSGEEQSDLLVRVEELSRGKGYTLQGLTSVYLNLVLLSRHSVVVEDALEIALSSTTAKIGFIDLKQVLVGIVNSGHWRKNLIVRVLSILQEYDWQNVPFYRIRETYHLLMSIQHRDITLLLHRIIPRLVHHLIAKLPTTSNKELVDLLDEFRNVPLQEKSLLTQMLRLLEERLAAGHLQHADLVACYSALVHLQANPWLGIFTAPLVEKLHSRLMGLEVSEEVCQPTLVALAKSRLPVSQRYKESVLRLGKADSLKIADGASLLPQELALIASVSARIPNLSLPELVSALESVTMAANSHTSPELSSLQAALVAQITLQIELSEKSIHTYVQVASQCMASTKKALQPATRILFDSTVRLLPSLTDVPFILWKATTLYAGLEREWKEMIESGKEHITNGDILKVLRLADDFTPFDPIVTLMSSIKKRLSDETILHASKFLYHSQSLPTKLQYLALISRLSPDCIFTEAYRFNFKRVFQVIKLNHLACLQLLEGIRDRIFAQSYAVSRDSFLQDPTTTRTCAMLSECGLLSRTQAERAYSLILSSSLVDYVSAATVIWPLLPFTKPPGLSEILLNVPFT